jgi:hypothetical protein
MKHKHYEFIVAWANGAKIQWKNDLHDWRDIGDPAWINSYEYRIKPEPKPDFIDWLKIGICCPITGSYARWTHKEDAHLKITFDGITREFKSAEVIK